MAKTCTFASILLALALTSAVAKEGSCAAAGTCLDSVEFETDGGLALMQKKAIAHHVAQSQAKGHGHEEIEYAQNAQDAEVAENAQNAEKAVDAENAKEAVNALHAQKADVAKNAKNSKYAINAENAEQLCGMEATADEPEKCGQLREIIASFDKKDNGNLTLLQQDPKQVLAGKETAKKLARRAKALVRKLQDNDAHGDDDHHDPYESPDPMCQDADNATIAQDAEKAKCAMNAVNAKFAKNAVNAKEAMNAKDAEEAENAENAEKAEFAEYAVYAELAIKKVSTEPAPATCDATMFEVADPTGGCMCMPDYQRPEGMNTTGACTPIPSGSTAAPPATSMAPGSTGTMPPTSEAPGSTGTMPPTSEAPGSTGTMPQPSMAPGSTAAPPATSMAPGSTAAPPPICNATMFEVADPTGGCMCMPDYQRPEGMTTGACTPIPLDLPPMNGNGTPGELPPLTGGELPPLD